MIAVNISEFRKNLSKYVSLLENNPKESILIYRYNKPIVKITPLTPIVGCGKDVPGIEKMKDTKEGFEDIPELFGY